jgi:hypothetical protein
MALKHRRVSEQELDEWKKAFEASMSEARPHEQYWAGILREYQGEPGWAQPVGVLSPEEQGPTDRPWVNYLLSQAQVIVATMMPRRPAFTFAATQREQVDLQRVMSAAGNYFWKRSGSTEKAREILLDVLLCGHGIGKVVWNDPDGVSAMHVADYEDGVEGSPDELAGLDPEVRRRARRALAQANVPLGRVDPLPALNRVPPWDLFRPAGRTSLRDSPWLMERHTLLLSDIERDPRFRLPGSVKADTVIRPVPLPDESSTIRSSDRKFAEPDAVTVFELHHWVEDRGQRTRFTTYFWAPGGLPTGIEVIGSVRDELVMPGWPYEMLRFTDVPGSFFSTYVSDLAAIRPVAARLNELVHYILRQHRTNSKRKMIIPKGLAPQEELEDFLTTDDEAAALEANIDDARAAFAVLPELKTPSDTEFIVALLRNLMMEVGSIDAAQRGAVNASTTATAARIADKGTQARSGVKQEVFAAWLERLIDKQMSIFRQMSSEPQQIRVAGETGPEFLDFDPQKINGKFDVEVEVSSMIPRDPAAQQEQLISLMGAINLIAQSLMPIVQAGILPPETLNRTFERIFTIYGENPEAFMGPIGDLIGQISDGVRRPAGANSTGGQAGPETPQPQPGPPSLSAVGGA